MPSITPRRPGSGAYLAGLPGAKFNEGGKLANVDEMRPVYAALLRRRLANPDLTDIRRREDERALAAVEKLIGPHFAEKEGRFADLFGGEGPRNLFGNEIKPQRAPRLGRVSDSELAAMGAERLKKAEEESGPLPPVSARTITSGNNKGMVSVRVTVGPHKGMSAEGHNFDDAKAELARNIAKKVSTAAPSLETAAPQQDAFPDLLPQLKQTSPVADKLADARDRLRRLIETLSGQEAQQVDESAIVNPIDRNASPEEKVRQLQALTAENKPLVEDFIRKIDQEFGTESKSNEKLPERIIEKGSRPTILARKPWHRIEHVRDSFRFKTVLNGYDELPAIIERAKQAGFEIVKSDVDKVLEPKEWGWRIASFDLRMPNGQPANTTCRSKSSKRPRGPAATFYSRTGATSIKRN